MAKDYYKILGLSKSASQDEIKSAYHKLAHKHHPDKAGGEEAKFKEINEAYSVLSDPDKRKRYDSFGAAFSSGNARGFNSASWNFEDFPFTANGNAADFGDFGDIFEEFFGFGQPKKKTTTGRGKDIVVDAEISLEEAYSGINKHLILNKYAPCERCNGKGMEPGSSLSTCKTCQGRGGLERVEQTFFGTFTRLTNCPNCHGRGEVPEKVCTTCRGEGRIKRSIKIDVQIPAGVDDGETLKVQGSGETGKYGLQSGDLFLNIHVKPHALFQRKGNDLWIKAEISFPQAVFGAKIDVPMINGEIKLNVPSGTGGGKVFRISGRGMPYGYGRSRNNAAAKGDAYVVISIKIPHSISKKTQKLLEELEGEL